MFCVNISSEFIGKSFLLRVIKRLLNTLNNLDKLNKGEYSKY